MHPIPLRRKAAVALVALLSVLGIFTPAGATDLSSVATLDASPGDHHATGVASDVGLDVSFVDARRIAGFPREIAADQAIDYSGARPAAGFILAHGYIGVIRYIGAAGDWRAMSVGELNSYRAAGLKVAVVYEEGNGDFWRGGYNAGCTVGRHARSYANNLGWTGPVYGATDVDVPPSGIPTAIEAYRGYKDCLGGLEPGVYGGKLLLRATRDALGYRLLWAASATSWDHGVSIPVSLQQYYNARPPIPNTDVNDIYGYWGYWPADGASETPNRLATPEQVTALLESWGFPCSDAEHAGTFWCVAAFQQRFGLNVDGVWGQETQAAAQAWFTFLLSVKAPPPPPTPEQAALQFLANCMSTGIGPGDTGPCVKLAQALLVHAGYAVAQTGEYSYETTGAVTVFEGDNGLPTDGQISPFVWASLTKAA